MNFSQTALETLIDLVEIKLARIEIADRDDAMEVASLRQCLIELGRARNAMGGTSSLTRRRGRPAKFTENMVTAQYAAA